MKCLLLLLASGLVTSDKLDHTYLPPPGAKYSGGTFDDLNPPLEFPKQTYTGVIQNAPITNSHPAEFTEIPNNHSIGKEIYPVSHSFLSFPNNFKQTTPFIMNRYQSVIPTSGPVLSMYGNILSNVPSSGYLPNKQSTFDTQPHNTLKYVPGFDGNRFISGGDKKATGYNYIPAKKHNRNGVENFNLNNNGYPNVKINQFPNQANGGLLSKGQNFIPKTVTAKEIVENYQPSSFGFYGGNPMIMTSHDIIPQEPISMKFTSKYGSFENNMPGSLDQNKVKPNEKTSARPFQTPLVGPNPENVLKHTSNKTTINAYGAIPSQFPTTTSKSFKKYIPTTLEQKNGIPVRNKVRQERPQTDFERNAVIINYDNSISPEGYSYSYDTSNGIHVDETGIATNGVKAKGSYSYTGDDGNIYTVTYTADENGFQPKGDHLPTAPPIPEAIQRVIEQAARNKVDSIFDDGSYDENKYGHMNYQGAMDRYNTFRENGIKKSRLNDTRRKPSRFQHNKNKTKFGDMVYNNIIPRTNNQTIENLSNFETEGINVQGNKLSNGSALSTETRFNSKKIITNKEQLNNQITKPIAYENNKQITNKKQEPTNVKNIDVTAINTEAKSSQNLNIGTSSRKTFIDEGYYYVPPIITFNENTENPLSSLKKNSFFTSSKTIPKITETETNKRIGFDESQRRRTDNEERSTQANTNSIASEPTRQPYISGPVDQDKNKSDTKQSDSYTYNLDSSLHNLDTTPMNTQATQESQVPDEYSQYYQSTTNPTILDQTLPNTVENRIKIPPRNTGITVSQDVVTTTYRPLLSGDGVLEVNQNVKIYGIGKPETTTPFNGYPEKNPDSNLFYTETTTNGQISMGEYPIYAGPVLDTAVFQEIPNQSVPYGNKYLTTGIPGTDLGINTDQYYNTGFDELPQGSPGLQPNAPIFNVNDFGNPEPIPEQGVTTHSIPHQNPGPGGQIIGEDFSGPGHPQKFDPETGYYYE